MTHTETQSHICGHSLSVYLPICLCIYLSVYLSVYLPVCLSACLPGWLFVCLSACLAGWLSVCLCIYLPTYIYLSDIGPKNMAPTSGSLKVSWAPQLFILWEE